MQPNLDKHNGEPFTPLKYRSFSKLENKDLRAIAIWGLRGEFSDSGALVDSNSFDEAVESVVSSFKRELSKSFPSGLRDIPRVKVPILRMVSLSDPDKLDTKNLGHSWFANPDRIRSDEFYHHLDHLKSGNVYVIHAFVDESNIDIPRTLWQRDINWDENEVVIRDDSKIDFIRIIPRY